MDVDPFAVRVIGLIIHAKGPEMAVLDPADVVALIDVQSEMDRVSEDAADEVARRPDKPDAIVRIQQQTIENRNIFDVFGQHAGRIRNRRHIALLPFRVGDDDAGKGGHMAGEADEGLSAALAASGEGQQHGAVHGGAPS